MESQRAGRSEGLVGWARAVDQTAGNWSEAGRKGKRRLDLTCALILESSDHNPRLGGNCDSRK